LLVALGGALHTCGPTRPEVGCRTPEASQRQFRVAEGNRGIFDTYLAFLNVHTVPVNYGFRPPTSGHRSTTLTVALSDVEGPPAVSWLGPLA